MYLYTHSLEIKNATSHSNFPYHINTTRGRELKVVKLRRVRVMVMAAATTALASAAANVVKGGGSGIILSYRCSRSFGVRRPSALPFARSISLLHTVSSSSSSIKTTAPARRGRVLHPSFCTASTEAAAAAETEAPPPPPPPTPTPIDEDQKIKEAANMLDIRVGRVIKAWRHEEADSLYVEEVDIGEPEPRIICSGLVNYIPLDRLQDEKVIVLANLKPRNMRGVKSCGMLMAASDASHENVELLVPPEGSLPGERIWFGSEDDKENQSAAATPNQVQKKKIWEMVQPSLRTDASCTAMLGPHLMRTSAGLVVSRSLKNANIS